MRATEKRKTILVVSDEEHDQRSGNISAAITCAKDAAADDYALFSWLESDTLLMKIP